MSFIGDLFSSPNAFKNVEKAFGSKKVDLPSAPTIDEAGKNRDEFDRIRRRRGVLATIFSNNASSTPAVATQQLLG